MSRGGKQPLLALSQRCNLVALRQLVAKALKSASKSNTHLCHFYHNLRIKIFVSESGGFGQVAPGRGCEAQEREGAKAQRRLWGDYLNMLSLVKFPLRVLNKGALIPSPIIDSWSNHPTTTYLCIVFKALCQIGIHSDYWSILNVNQSTDTFSVFFIDISISYHPCLGMYSWALPS